MFSLITKCYNKLSSLHCRYSDLSHLYIILICTSSQLYTNFPTTLQHRYIQIKPRLIYTAMVAFGNLTIDEFNISKLKPFLLRLLIIHSDEIAKHILFDSHYLLDLAQGRRASVLMCVHWFTLFFVLQYEAITSHIQLWDVITYTRLILNRYV